MTNPPQTSYLLIYNRFGEVDVLKTSSLIMIRHRTWGMEKVPDINAFSQEGFVLPKGQYAIFEVLEDSHVR